MKRIVPVLVCMAALAGPASADELITLKEKAQVGTQIHHSLELAITGKMQVDKGDQPLSGKATLQYPERIVELDADGSPKKVLRYYGGARARFQVAASDEDRSLRQPIRMIVGDRTGNALVLWSPGGPLTGDERELVEDVLDATRIPGLLPKQPVKVGDGWKIDSAVVQGLCNLDSMIGAEMQATLSEVKDGKATIKITGSAHGMSLGAEAKMRVDATAVFNIAGALVEKLVWAQSDSRAASPVAPAGTYQANITVVRDRSEAAELTDKAIADIDLTAKEASKQIVFEGPKQAYKFTHDRDWHITSVQPTIVVMRRVQGNEFIAQLSIAVLADRPNAAPMKSEEFQKLVEQANSVKLEEVVRTEDLPAENGVKMQRIVGKGSAEKIKLSHRHYLAVSPTGKRVMFSFLLEPVNDAKLAEADAKLVGALEFPTPQTANKSSEPSK